LICALKSRLLYQRQPRYSPRDVSNVLISITLLVASSLFDVALCRVVSITTVTPPFRDLEFIRIFVGQVGEYGYDLSSFSPLSSCSPLNEFSLLRELPPLRELSPLK
jgi:hypothetical protein